MSEKNKTVIKNFFLVHTHFQVILALTIIESQHKDEKNFLYYLYRSQAHLWELENYLAKKKILYFFDNGFNHYGGLFNLISNEIKDFKRTVKFKKITETFFVQNNIYMVQEEYLFTHWICILNKNPDILLNNVEDGNSSYFDSWTTTQFRKKSRIFKLIINILRKNLREIVFGKNTLFEENFVEYGRASFYDYNYVLFPNLVSNDISINKVKAVNNKIFLTLLGILHKKKLQPRQFKVLLFLDGNTLDNIDSLTLKRLLSALCKLNLNVYLKCHPLGCSIDSLEDYTNLILLDSNLSAESIITEERGNCVVITGKSTVICAAKILKVPTYTYYNLKNTAESQLLNYFNELGVKVIYEIKDSTIMINNEFSEMGNNFLVKD